MTTPRDPDGRASTAPSALPVPESVEPGHRARALAASLLGELTGQRRGPSLLDPLAPAPSRARTEADAREAAADADRSPSAVTRPSDVPPLTPPVVRAAAPTAAPSATPPSAPGQPASVPQAATPLDAAPAAAGPGAAPAAAPARPATDAPAAPPVGPSPTARHDEPTTTPEARRTDEQRPAPEDGSRTQERPATAEAEPQPTTTAVPAEREQASASPVPTSGGDRGHEVRPAPFAYTAVAQHHTVPARATANGALDQAGQRISSRVDRALARRAAQVTIEAASLLDACDVLDGRAQAVDATWTGERHSATEVREFEGAWGAFYDARGALAQHVTT